MPAAPFFFGIGPAELVLVASWTPLELVFATPLFLDIRPFSRPMPEPALAIEGCVAEVQDPASVPMPSHGWFGQLGPAIVWL